MSWHWESYVHKNNLWYHFQRFSEAIKGINPIEEQFIPVRTETSAVRIYCLKGKKTTLLWLRDKMNNWGSELQNGIAPGMLRSLRLNLREFGSIGSPRDIEVYDPWNDTWTKPESVDASIVLPDFKRSIVVRFEAN